MTWKPARKSGVPPEFVPFLTVHYGPTHAYDLWICGVCQEALPLDVRVAHAHLAKHARDAKRLHRRLQVTV